MSKRHHSSRRRSYGRRQHELRERVDRHLAPDTPERVDLAWADPVETPGESFAFLDPRAPRLRFVMGD